MAYIIKRKNREGKEYVYLVEGYRVKDKVMQRTLKKYGRLEDLEREEPGAFERLRREAKEGLLHEETKEDLTVTLDLSTQIKDYGINYSWLILNEIYESLGITEVTKKFCTSKKIKNDLNKVLKLLTLQRILNPKSKSATVKSQTDLYGDWDVSQNSMDRALDYFEELKPSLEQTIHKKITETIVRTGILVFYDVTNYYFETDFDDEDILDEMTGKIVENGIRKRGCEKNRRPDPIVQLGLFMDTNGIPITYKLFAGNTNDTKTYLPALEQVKKQFGLERIITVADKAMNSKTNVQENSKVGDGWLFSQKIRGKQGVAKELQEFALSPSDWEYNNSLTFAKKSMIRTRKLDKGITVEEKVLVTWNKKYAERERIRRDGALEYARNLQQPERYRISCRKGGKKYLKQYAIDRETGDKIELNPFLSIDYALADYDSQFDGLNVYVTSEINMSDEDILESYRALSKIEDCFRVTKTDMHSRPVYVWTESHIQAHFLTCYLSLIFLRILQVQTKWKISAGKIIDGLQSGITSEVGKGYHRVHANENLKELLKNLEIEWELEYVKSEKLKYFAKDWFTTKY